MTPVRALQNGGRGLANGVCAADFDRILEFPSQISKRLDMLDFESQNIYPIFGRLVWPNESGINEILRRLSMVSPMGSGGQTTIV